jgi:hypothetical protein
MCLRITLRHITILPNVGESLAVGLPEEDVEVVVEIFIYVHGIHAQWTRRCCEAPYPWHGYSKSRVTSGPSIGNAGSISGVNSRTEIRAV